MNLTPQPKYYVAFAETVFNSWAEVQRQAPQELAEHLARSKQLHADGTLLMAGVFLDRPEEPVMTMGVLVSREAAEAYLHGDPFVLKGQVKRWHIREWANMFYTPPADPLAY
jgi:uncharacterized protein YciI